MVALDGVALSIIGMSGLGRAKSRFENVIMCVWWQTLLL